LKCEALSTADQYCQSGARDALALCPGRHASGADGFELCRQIRQTPLLSVTPIIFLTAKTAEADREKDSKMGGDDYITKPFSPRELVARCAAFCAARGRRR